MKTIRRQTVLRLEDTDHQKIMYIAAKNKRSFNAQIEFLVQECVASFEEKNGKITLPQD